MPNPVFLTSFVLLVLCASRATAGNDAEDADALSRQARLQQRNQDFDRLAAMVRLRRFKSAAEVLRWLPTTAFTPAFKAEVRQCIEVGGAACDLAYADAIPKPGRNDPLSDSHRLFYLVDALPAFDRRNALKALLQAREKQVPKTQSKMTFDDAIAVTDFAKLLANAIEPEAAERRMAGLPATAIDREGRQQRVRTDGPEFEIAVAWARRGEFDRAMAAVKRITPLYEVSWFSLRRIGQELHRSLGLDAALERAERYGPMVLHDVLYDAIELSLDDPSLLSRAEAHFWTRSPKFNRGSSGRVNAALFAGNYVGRAQCEEATRVLKRAIAAPDDLERGDDADAVLGRAGSVPLQKLEPIADLLTARARGATRLRALDRARNLATIATFYARLGKLDLARRLIEEAERLAKKDREVEGAEIRTVLREPRWAIGEPESTWSAESWQDDFECAYGPSRPPFRVGLGGLRKQEVLLLDYLERRSGRGEEAWRIASKKLAAATAAELGLLDRARRPLAEYIRGDDTGPGVAIFMTGLLDFGWEEIQKLPVDGGERASRAVSAAHLAWILRESLGLD